MGPGEEGSARDHVSDVLALFRLASEGFGKSVLTVGGRVSCAGISGTLGACQRGSLSFFGGTLTLSGARAVVSQP